VNDEGSAKPAQEFQRGGSSGTSLSVSEIIGFSLMLMSGLDLMQPVNGN